MANEVIKRRGKREPFRAEKIRRSISIAVREAHVPAVRVKSVVSKVSGPVLKFAAKRKAIGTATLRQKILAQLDKLEPNAAKVWRKYDRRRQVRRAQAKKRRR